MISKIPFHDGLKNTIDSLIKRFDTLPEGRKAILIQLAGFIQKKVKDNEKADLVFICTHNSRRSHVSQIWAQAAAAFFGVPNVTSYSGGTEVTAFNPRAVTALENAGFKITKKNPADNPVYEVSFSDSGEKIIAFSKKFDSPPNPANGFAAIMTCTHADENCPVVHGMEKRISLPYDDPKDFDDTPQETQMYNERVMQIGTEILYAFSKVTAR